MTVNMEDIVHSAVKQMNEMRKQGQHDVVIRVGETQFPCHRHLIAAACPMLKPMLLEEDWHREKHTLSGVESSMFKIIVDYVYTGAIVITTDNAFNMLKAADYLCMDGLMELCVAKLKISCPIEDLMEAYEFAKYLKNPDFIDELETRIAKRTSLLRLTVKFLSLSFEALNSISDKLQQVVDREGNCYLRCCDTYVPSSVVQGSCQICKKAFNSFYEYKATFYHTILAWIKADIVTRIGHLHLLYKYATESEFADDLKSLSEYHRTELKKHIEENYNVTNTKLLVHISKGEEVDTLVKLSNSSEWIRSDKFATSASRIKTTSKNRRVFYLSYNTFENQNEFWTTNEKEVEYLSAPPSIVFNYKLASAEDIIYLFDFTRKRSSLALPEGKETDLTNVYSFVAGKNRWFSEPCSPKPLYHSYFVSLKNSVYLIGGTEKFQLTYQSGKYVQRYDPRVAKWDVISENFETVILLTGSACGYEDKIYICSKPEPDGDSVDKEECKIKFYTFDIRFNKWIVEDYNLKKRFEPAVMVPFENQLWAFSKNPQDDCMVYNFDKNVWNEEKMLFGDLNDITDYQIVGASAVDR